MASVHPSSTDAVKDLNSSDVNAQTEKDTWYGPNMQCEIDTGKKNYLSNFFGNYHLV